MTDAEADLEEVLRVLVRLASGDFAARGTASGASEEFAALLLGVNMLAEELEAGRAELEQRVRTRTAELERLNSDIQALSALGDRLQHCGSTEEAIAVTVQGVEAMFAHLTGALYLPAAETDALALVTSWGGASPVGTTLRTAECQALHRVHGRTDGSAGPVRGCTHLMGGNARLDLCPDDRTRTGAGDASPGRPHGRRGDRQCTQRAAATAGHGGCGTCGHGTREPPPA